MWYRYELVPLHTVVLIIVVGCEHALALLDMTEDPVELVERRVGKNQFALALGRVLYLHTSTQSLGQVVL